MIVNILDAKKSILNKFISEIRDVTVQKDSMRFRRNIGRIGEIISYELSKSLVFENNAVTTPLGTKIVATPKKDIVLCSILRAGLPLHEGLLNYFDDAENGFISAYRKHINDTEFEIKVEYFASPNLDNKTLILADPMLATGQSITAVYEGLKKHGTPKEIHLACVIGSTEGVEYIKDHFPENTKLWIGTVDEKLNDHGYIVPGLGDAGDLAYGTKL
ncbi:MULTISPECIES: uracil phosphoribosyltransferase [Flavobacteriaceae]|uniref:Uracil phosphoribosyltransferase n=2 Tax=Flavobacteriaceae TaxID=49546 RepID=A0A4Y8ATL4_9FLAO|nr:MULTISPECIES: uracil phosphoribosyltransferase [Flavobacteriaceae]TEW74016.1 uracil phosphoribosyltransferase [Gramella jeungdoensis]GGK39656.1 uracil phosphoribosyltransferase [Lutibacter litoralis]